MGLDNVYRLTDVRNAICGFSYGNNVFHAVLNRIQPVNGAWVHFELLAPAAKFLELFDFRLIADVNMWYQLRHTATFPGVPNALTPINSRVGSATASGATARYSQNDTNSPSDGTLLKEDLIEANTGNHGFVKHSIILPPSKKILVSVGPFNGTAYLAGSITYIES